jgi:hypothetical protein
MQWALIIFCVLFLILGCTGNSPKKELTKRQRDSVLAESKLPGSKTVGKAIEISDSSRVKAKRIDDLNE